MAERPESLPTTTLGNYKVRAKIGSGGMGDVYDALHTGLEKRVAIKTLRKRFLDDEIVVARFLREGQLASRIRHPNIVDVTDVGMMGGLPCLVMEHLEGESFSGMIRREGRLPITTIVDLLLPIIAAVDFAHDHGIVHRDLKPSNLFLARSWNGDLVPKVLDFGISKLVHDSQQAVLTTDSAFVGTPHYASPELMRADKAADGRSDQYSMGVILYEAATGIRPFADLGNNFIALAMAICKAEYPPARDRNPDVPVAFDRVIQRSMALHAEDRFITMRALGEALLPFASERARLIWGPTFNGQNTTGPIQPTTPARPSHPSSGTMEATVAESPSQAGRLHPGPPASARSQAAPMASYASPPSTPSHASYPSHGSHPSAMSVHPFPAPPYSSESLRSYPSTTPPGAAFDRLPSYGTSAPIAKPRGGNGAVTAIIAVSCVLALVGSGLLLFRGTHRGTEVPTAAAAQVATTYAVDLQVTPSTSTIELDDAGVGQGRLVRTFARDAQKHRLRISAPGFEGVLVEFDETRPPPPAITLRAAAAAAAPATSTGAGAPPPVGAGGKRVAPTAPVGKTGAPAGRPKTDNIDPWE